MSNKDIKSRERVRKIFKLFNAMLREITEVQSGEGLSDYTNAHSKLSEEVLDLFEELDRLLDVEKEYMELLAKYDNIIRRDQTIEACIELQKEKETSVA